MENDKSYFDTIDMGGLTYPVVKRKKGSNRIDECPYCGEKHSHGETTGHRSASCKGPGKSYESVSIKGIIIPKSRGYIIREYCIFNRQPIKKLNKKRNTIKFSAYYPVDLLFHGQLLTKQPC